MKSNVSKNFSEKNFQREDFHYVSSSYTLNVEWEQVDAIIKGELRNIIDDMNREDGSIIWSHDPDVEEMKRNKMIDACKRILEYYGDKNGLW
jgi:hypothetical protein